MLCHQPQPQDKPYTAFRLCTLTPGNGSIDRAYVHRAYRVMKWQISGSKRGTGNRHSRQLECLHQQYGRRVVYSHLITLVYQPSLSCVESTVY